MNKKYINCLLKDMKIKKI